MDRKRVFCGKSRLFFINIGSFKRSVIKKLNYGCFLELSVQRDLASSISIFIIEIIICNVIDNAIFLMSCCHVDNISIKEAINCLNV